MLPKQSTGGTSWLRVSVECLFAWVKSILSQRERDSPPVGFPRALCDRGYKSIETRRREVDGAALFGTEISGHQHSDDLYTIFESEHRFFVLQESPHEVTILRFVSVRRGLIRHDGHLAHFRVLFLDQILTGLALHLTAEEQFQSAVQRIP